MSSNSVFLSVSFPDIDILHPALLSVPPRTMCLFNYWIAYIREGRVLKVTTVARPGGDALVPPGELCQDPAGLDEGDGRPGGTHAGGEIEVMIREEKLACG